ncbi:MAG TPA: diacylglycerol kinase family protein [Vicinamibacterales bacterium]|nr:diacylglycerol kinase family protein [Vicinamibacterales bacterium]
MKTRLIVNPVSGRDQAAAELPAMNEQLRGAFPDLDIVMTTGEGDAERAARQATADGYGRLLVAGGDGTLNETLNGVDAAGGLDRVVVGLVPIGTGNDFAGTLGVPDGIEAAIEVVRAGREVHVDVGTLNGRLFVNASAGGFIAEVSDALSPSLKTLAGKFAYLIAGAGVFFDFTPPEASILVGRAAVPVRRSVQLFVVGNGRTIGGGRAVTPHARLDDGLLDVCVVQAASTPELVALLRRMSDGQHLDDPLVTYEQAATARFAFDRVIKVNTDGEVLETDRCEYGIRPRAARFLA